MLNLFLLITRRLFLSKIRSYLCVRRLLFNCSKTLIAYCLHNYPSPWYIAFRSVDGSSCMWSDTLPLVAPAGMFVPRCIHSSVGVFCASACASAPDRFFAIIPTDCTERTTIYCAANIFCIRCLSIPFACYMPWNLMISWCNWQNNLCLSSVKYDGQKLMIPLFASFHFVPLQSSSIKNLL